MGPTNLERLRRRVHAMHVLWNEAIEPLSTEQMNFRAGAGVLPIGFSLVHFVRGEDRSVSGPVLNEPTLFEAGDWETRIGGTLPDLRRGTPMEIAETVEIGNSAVWKDYQRTVFDRTESVLASLSAEDYERVLYDTLPEPMQPSFLGYLVEPGEPVVLGDLLDAFVYQHGIRHLGEIDHARALAGG